MNDRMIDLFCDCDACSAANDRRSKQREEIVDEKPITYTVFIRNNATGEVRSHGQTLPWAHADESGSGSIWWWTEGSMGCDCNRLMEFGRASGMDEEEVWNKEHPCGDTAFSLVRVEFPDGRALVPDSGTDGRHAYDWNWEEKKPRGLAGVPLVDGGGT